MREKQTQSTDSTPSREEVGLIYCQKCEEYYEQTVESDLCELCNSNRIVIL